LAVAADASERVLARAMKRAACVMEIRDKLAAVHSLRVAQTQLEREMTRQKAQTELDSPQFSPVRAAIEKCRTTALEAWRAAEADDEDAASNTGLSPDNDTPSAGSQDVRLLTSQIDQLAALPAVTLADVQLKMQLWREIMGVDPSSVLHFSAVDRLALSAAHDLEHLLGSPIESE
jgi:hypothetical protein